VYRRLQTDHESKRALATHRARARARGLAVEAEVNHAQLQHDHAEHVGEELQGLNHEERYEDLMARAKRVEVTS
jgi:hypothetical protein